MHTNTFWHALACSPEHKARRANWVQKIWERLRQKARESQERKPGGWWYERAVGLQGSGGWRERGERERARGKSEQKGGRGGDRRRIVGHVARAEKRRVLDRRHELVVAHHRVERVFGGGHGIVALDIARGGELAEVPDTLIIVCT